MEIVVPDDSLEEYDPYFKEGATVVINGDNVEEFLRYRDSGKSQSALVRQQRQKTYLKALIPKLQEKTQTDSSFVGNMLNDIQPYTVTNMGNDVFVKLLNAAGNSTLETQTVPGEELLILPNRSRKQRQIKRNLRILIRLQRKTRLLIQTNLQSPRTVRHRMLIRVIQRPGTVKRNED